MADLLLEEVGRALLLTVKDNINAVIDEVWTEMAVEDTEFYAALGQDEESTPLVYPVAFYLGHIPDILDHDVSGYPSVVAMCYDHGQNDSAFDQVEELSNGAFVEAFVVDSDASTVNRLAWRYAKALHRLLTTHKSLGEWPTIWELDGSPAVTVSQSIAKRVTEFGDDWTYLQGCRLEFTYKTPVEW